jgi:hypothetical protein
MAKIDIDSFIYMVERVEKAGKLHELVELCRTHRLTCTVSDEDQKKLDDFLMPGRSVASPDARTVSPMGGEAVVFYVPWEPYPWPRR